MEAGLRSRNRKRKHQSSISDGIFTRSKSQIYVHRHRSGYARADSVRTSNPILPLEGTTKSLPKQERWGYMFDNVTSEVSVKDLRARRIFSPTTITDEVLSIRKVGPKADIDGNPNVSSLESDAGHGDLGVSSSVANGPKTSSENIVDSFPVSENNVIEADFESGTGHGDLGVSSSAALDPKSSLENNVDSYMVSDNHAMEADEAGKMTPRVIESDQIKGVGEKNNTISVANEVIDTQASMSKSQSSVTSLRSKKKVFICPKSFSYRRLLPYLTEIATDDSPKFEILEATTLPKAQKSIDKVPNLVAYEDQKIDAIQKSHEDALNDILEEGQQMTPPDSDIYSKPNIDKSPEVKTTVSNENNDSISASNLILKSCSRIKMLKTPTSFSYRRLLPFLMSVSKPETTSEQNQQLPTPSMMHQNIVLDESRSITDEKSDSPTSLNPIETSFDSSITTATVVSNDNVLDSDVPVTKLTESTLQLDAKSQSEADCLMKLEQESPIKEPTCNSEIVPSVDTIDIHKLVNGSTHESLMQIAPLNSPLIKENSSRSGILKRTPRGCRGICNCLNCTTFRLHAERSFEFSRNQMHDAEEVALELINYLTFLRNILERTVNDTVNDKEVKEVCEKALYKEEVARARLAQMNEDLSFHCRSMTPLRPKVTFANKIEEKVISDRKGRR